MLVELRTVEIKARLIIKPVVEHDCKDYEEIIKCKNVIIIGVVNYHGEKK
jgi:hypothetical protein